jgi:parallel beta-helix repeat protein
MKLLLLLVFFFSAFKAGAANYYFSATGNDANAGTSISTAWHSISKFNSVFKSFSPGDSILFERGDVFYGSLKISRSGKLGLPITIGAYGEGASPIITGFTKIDKWKNVGSNIWESAEKISTLSSANMVIVKGVNTAMGRFPNTGYLTYENFTNATIISAGLSPNVDWTGAIAVIRKNNWIIDKDTITAQSAGTLSCISHSNYKGQRNYGFFIENDPRTLDQQNEWYYNTSLQKLKFFSKNYPTKVQVSTIDTLVSINGSDNINFTGISFTGSNKIAFAINFSHRIQIINCDIDFSGENAIVTRGGSCDYFDLINSTINHTNNNAIDLGGASPNCLLYYDTIKNTGVLAGMGGMSDKTFTAVQSNSDNGLIENCFIDSTGYNGIVFYGNNTIIRNNLVSNFCLTKFDGGGIYTFAGNNEHAFTGQKLLNNIVINGIGNVEGTIEKIPLVHGIYIDEGTGNIEIAGNTVADNSYSGLYFHNSFANNTYNNTFYDNKYCQLLIAGYNNAHPVRNLKLKNNILVSKSAQQRIISFQSRVNDISNFGIQSDIDSNYFVKPINANTNFETVTDNYEKTSQKTFDDWQSYSGFDKHSSILTLTTGEINDIQLLYNQTGANKIVNLNGKYSDVKNVMYSGKITLAPYTSVVLIRKE